MRTFLLPLFVIACVFSARADDPLGPYLERDGIVIFEAESTESNLDLWSKKTAIQGYQGEGYIEFGGNNPASGPAKSPLEFEFKITKPGLYRLHLHCARIMVVINGENRNDVANDGYVRVEGDYGEGPNAGNEHKDDAPLSMLKKDTKFFGGANGRFVWASGNRLDPGGHDNKRVAVYDFKEGETYKFVLSGRSQFFKVDRIMFRHVSVPAGEAEDLSNPQSLRAGQKIGYRKFAEEHGITGELHDDDDKDGLSNFYEFSVGGDPMDAANRGLAPGLVRAEDGSLLFRSIERKDEPYRGVNYVLQMRSNLAEGEWVALNGVVATRVPIPERQGYEEVLHRVADAADLPTAIFFRVKVEEDL